MQVHSCAVTPGLERRARELSLEMSKLERQVIIEHWMRLVKKDRKPLYDRDVDELAESPSSERAQDYVLLRAGLDAPRRFRAGELTEPGDPRFARYQAMQAELKSLELRVPSVRFGYRPALDGLASMLSAMFAHGGWLHLLGNMWFLYMVGCNLEDRWGRWQFLSFYGVAGCIAALTFTSLHPETESPLVGASGAVAGAMGAFMACFARTKVKMFYVYALMITPRWGTFSAPAWAVLALWMVEQFAMTLVEVSSTTTQIAYSAHAGGFLFGAVIALLLRRTGVDSQLDDASERAAEQAAVVWSEHPLYLEAVSLRDRGDDARAAECLVELLGESPEHVGAREVLFDLGLARGDLRCVDLGLGFLVGHYARVRAHEPLAALYRELRRALPDYGLTDEELLRVATAASHVSDGPLAIHAIGELLQQHPESALQPRALWVAAEVQAHFGSADLQRDTLTRIVRRFPEHACATLARDRLGHLEVGAGPPNGLPATWQPEPDDPATAQRVRDTWQDRQDPLALPASQPSRSRSLRSPRERARDPERRTPQSRTAAPRVDVRGLVAPVNLALDIWTNAERSSWQSALRGHPVAGFSIVLLATTSVFLLVYAAM